MIQMTMRLFLDSNIMTYIAIFESYLCEGNEINLVAAKEYWEIVQNSDPDQKLLAEINALRLLYLYDDQARFDWLFSDTGLDEIIKIRNEYRRSAHNNFLERLIEHRIDIYNEEGRIIRLDEIKQIRDRYFPHISHKMENDALQFCEAEIVEADYFLTNDLDFINKTKNISSSVTASRVSKLPFLASLL